MKILQPCTLADVARHAGVAISTASIALRNDPRLPAATRQRIKEVAQQLKYQPDPVLAALVNRRLQRNERASFANVAVVIDDRWKQIARRDWLREFLRGLRGTCRELGYHSDVLYIQSDLGGSHGAGRVLRARGIRGLALLPTPGQPFELTLDWKELSVVAVGNLQIKHRFHRVGSDAFASMQVVCDQLVAHGYRRIGLTHTLEIEHRLRYEWLGAIAKEAYLANRRFEVIPPHLPEVLEEKPFLRWVKQHNPDCLISNDDRPYRWLEAAGWRIPRDIGFVSLNREVTPRPNTSGIAQHLDVMGENAAELLHTLLTRGETGIPRHPKEVLVYPHWVEGQTIRKQKPIATP